MIFCPSVPTPPPAHTLSPRRFTFQRAQLLELILHGRVVESPERLVRSCCRRRPLRIHHPLFPREQTAIRT